jgi:hypothetical protein
MAAVEIPALRVALQREAPVIRRGVGMEEVPVGDTASGRNAAAE